MKSISPLKDSDEGIRIQDDNTFENLEELLKYYKTNRLDPAFPTIGQGITEDGYKAKVREIRQMQQQQQQQEQQQAGDVDPPPGRKCTIL